MERDGLLIQAKHWFRWILRSFVKLQQVLHPGYILFIEFGNGRGRDTGHPAPPAQIPTSGTTA
jgi:hypothetical protein